MAKYLDSSVKKDKHDIVANTHTHTHRSEFVPICGCVWR